MSPSRPEGGASRATEKAMAGSTDSPGVLIFPPFLFGGSLLLGLALHWLHPIRLMPVVPARVLGTTLFLIGVSLAPVVILTPALGLLHRGIVLASYKRHGFGAWAVVFKETGRLIGFGGLEILTSRSGPEVSYILASEFWGRGLATEFAAAAIGHGFRICGLRVIGASFDPANIASMRVAEKVGMCFLREGVDEYDLPTVFYVVRNPDPGSRNG